MVRSPTQSVDPNDPARRNRDEQRERQQQDDLLDEALEETFPASDPIAPATPRDRKTS